uniref:Uncharacterized protein n=1 Tax=Clytia hemisphaerica TaxID=252671 RepID=A0A7M5V619_9CNID|eukprot:TCONS_00023393-protein
MDSEKRSYFVPPSTDIEKIEPLFIDDGHNRFLENNFDATGKYHLITFRGRKTEDITICVVSFNQNKKTLQNKSIIISSPSQQNSCWNFDFVGKKFIRARKSENDILIHFIDISQMIDVNFQTIRLETSVEPDMTITYNEKETPQKYLLKHFHRHGKTTFLLIVFGYGKTHYIDFAVADKNNLRHSKRIHVCFPEALDSLSISDFCEARYFCERFFIIRYNPLKIWSYEYETSECHVYTASDIDDEFIDPVEIYNANDLPFLCVTDYLENNTPSINVYLLKDGMSRKLYKVRNKTFETIDLEFDNLVRRFGMLLLQLLRIDNDEFLHLIDAKTSEVVHEGIQHGFLTYINDQKKSIVNWNLEEIGVVYIKDMTDSFYFQLVKTNIFKSKSLKHLAALAVLTNFSNSYILRQNIPRILFDYMGI